MHGGARDLEGTSPTESGYDSDPGISRHQRRGDDPDTYEDALRKLIDKKIAGEEIITPAVEALPKVVNLMDASRKSLDQVATRKKRPAKATAAARKPARVARFPARKRA